MKKRILSLLLAALLLVSLLPLGVLAEDVPAVTGSGILSINKYGILKLNMTHSDILNVFEYGDVVTVTVGSVTFDAPIVTAYSCVDAGEFGVFLQHEGEVEEVKLGINKGNFADNYGIALRPDPENNPTGWEYNEGFSADMSYTITLKEKGTYREQFLLRSMEYTNNREDYPNLNDAQFGNFREVTTGRIAPGVLYRSATPVDPKNNRNTYADAAAKEAGVNVFIDLADPENLLADFEGYGDSWFASQQHIALNMTMDFSQEENREKLAQGLRFMAENPGVYDVFCVEGKDRTGIVMALLEALMGATLEEIGADYMMSFRNYYGVELGSESYQAVLAGGVMQDLAVLFGEVPEDLEAAAEKYILELGLTQQELAALKTNLGDTEETAESETVPETAPETVPETTAETAAPAEKHSVNPVAIVLCVIAGFALGFWLAAKWMKKK